MQGLSKIVTIGPESTGKSTLCTLLAQQFNTVWCPEYAREYLLQHGTNYTYDQLLDIAKGQLALEAKYAKKAKESWQQGGKTTSRPLLIVDTDMYVMKVWCEYVFGKCHQFILDQVLENTCDGYLLCNIDLPWVKDELREYPDLQSRAELYHIYKDILVNQSVPWIEVSGDYDNRLTTAIRFVESLT